LPKHKPIHIHSFIYYTLLMLLNFHSYGKRSKLHGSYLQARGWDFPGDDEPHYKDFLYFSFGIGMTCRRCRCADRFPFD
ncbi:DUF1345 domain-containing protein, partial [Microcoleus sp. AR_TQ3_B6]|uniref:DUF1345 domain-containing protein n=1 Tax=Microcoleus sp. AR_TQ3_B6 TaxID=3055284 RepID=UPI002FD3D5F0